MASFQTHEVPVIVGSFGAAAVLEFYSIESPLAQPRNAVISQVLASVVAVSIRKLFELGTGSRDYIWIGGSLSCALATALMALTNTVHPPAGATALLAVVDSNMAGMGWFLIPVMLLGCVLMQAVALLINNIQRRFPMYWWSPEEVGLRWKQDKKSAADRDVETGSGAAVEKTNTSGSSQFDDGRTLADTSPQLVVTRTELRVPEGMYLTSEEFNFLEELRDRL
ncbi:hypothetical protein TruAng_007359 [Truncatella angustata]|nr:hypothetical protein TruAng_007359 [Truncatella angustata]